MSGVPQNTVLGLLLFSLYINDLLTDIDSEIRFFADDCACYREIKDTEDTLKLQKKYRSIEMLGKEMRYEISTCKLQYDANDKETDKKDPCSYTKEETVLENVESIKYLGVTITMICDGIHVSNISDPWLPETKSLRLSTRG